ncbi:hypothetical protein RB195_012675 [Necator americanus]|uniref:Uncharacterized protein n=1 Tax=Necator americanus TaxID=51031 RepID=A0ABR1DS28_NECAM
MRAKFEFIPFDDLGGEQREVSGEIRSTTTMCECERRPPDRLVERILRSLSGSSWKKPPGRKRKFWTDVVKEDLTTLGVDTQFMADVKFRSISNSDEWIASGHSLAEDREGWAELCSRTTHLGEDAGILLRRKY